MRRGDLQRLPLESYPGLSAASRGGQNEEDAIAEHIYDYWISGKPFKKWFADKFQEQEIEFGDDRT